ncbi:nucleoside deaminase [Nodosilinea sp. LEGE 07088]|uniref:tRNA adenosine(34) deaminase TadA n=1 Tax=Nodosilinea sp. LEGE 07088 TaxID=2777968 RepID=UPI00187FE7FA|nr:tRNA adenosine(34) deaminase TadA [Nodosilinea sp. LEGE 07088]MBE9136057.1 nucleoside deaminase [Nodosilinea sp. LEGE 07088]
MPYDVPPLDLENEAEVTHRRWMLRSLELAEIAGAAGDVPVGAVVVGPGGVVLAETGNRREQDQDPTAHAEILALREAARRLGNWHLNECTLYVTLEPCPMCAGAIILSRLGLLVYGTADPKAGAVRSVLNLPDGPCSNHRLTVVPGILAEPCRQQLQQWFQQRRQAQRRQF